MKNRKSIPEFENSRGPPIPRSTVEIQSLVCYGEESDNENGITFPGTQRIEQPIDKPTAPWQVCVDENTGYTYYWNMNTNQVTWEPPPDYLMYESSMQQWKIQKAANSIQFQESSEKLQANSETTTNNINSSINRSGIELISAYGTPSDDSSPESSKIVSKIINPDTENPASKIPSISNPPPIIDSLFKYVDPADGSIENCTDKNSLVKLPDNIRKSSRELNASPEQNIGIDEAKINNDESKSNKNSDNETSDEEELDDVIISRLRKKATLLQQLGGKVPKELMSVFDDTKSAEDIIAEIEKEIPVESLPTNVDMSNDLISVDSSEKSKSENIVGKPLFPIIDYVNKEEFTDFKTPKGLPINSKNKIKNVKKIKLSARAKELIHASLLTAKARATNFIETDDGLKPAEEIEKFEKENDPLKSQNEDTKNANFVDDIKITKLTKNDKKPPNYFNLIDESSKEEKKVNVLPPKLEENISMTKNSFKAVKCDTDKPEDEKYNFQKSFMVYYPKDKKNDETLKKNEDGKNTSLWSKCEEFLKSEEKRSTDGSSRIIKENDKNDKRDCDKKNEKTANKEKLFNEIDIDEVLNTKNDDEEKKTMDLTQLTMEKLKFLNDGKNSVAPVQVMAIQIETLVAAWQSGSLTLKYLSDWLSASVVQLKSIEDAAAPSGWHCEWDRSYGRYYYRNKITGSIQWEFPDYDTKSSRSCSRRSSRSSSRRSSRSRSRPRRPRTPPPPVISDIVPPPPPVISDYDRKRKSSPRRSYHSSDRRKKSSDRYERSRYSSSKSRRYSSPSHCVPPLPVVPPKPETPPPPPPSSPPPQPPPPPVISPSEFGTKNSQSNFADECTTVTPMEIENDLEDKPIKTAVLHDELHSFYSDIASIEANFVQGVKIEENIKTDEQPKLSGIEKQTTATTTTSKVKIEEKVKKRKKVKLDSGLSLKKKGIEGLVAKWQKVNSDI